MKYHEYIKSPEWIERTEKVRERNNGMCECCNMRFIANTHHRTYDNLGSEKEEDLIGLCVPCHEYIHNIHDDIAIRGSYEEKLKSLRKEAQSRGLYNGRTS